MKNQTLTLTFLTTCLIILSFGCVSAQEDSIELQEIKGSHSQEYQALKIEVTAIKRIRMYQPYWHKSGRPRGGKIVADSGSEIALVSIRTTRLGTKPGFNINQLYIIDSSAKKFETSQMSNYFLGTRSESGADPTEHDYEFPVIVPKETRFSAVQLRSFVANETKPFFIFQNLTFDVKGLGW